MSVTTPVRPTCDKFADPRVPQWWFEYHATIGKVYRCDIPGKWIDGTFVPDLLKATATGSIIAEHVPNYATAYGFVQTYVRAYLYFFQEHEELKSQERLEKELWLRKIPLQNRSIQKTT